jgi:hypothetical protein
MDANPYMATTDSDADSADSDAGSSDAEFSNGPAEPGAENGSAGAPTGHGNSSAEERKFQLVHFDQPPAFCSGPPGNWRFLLRNGGAACGTFRKEGNLAARQMP